MQVPPGGGVSIIRSCYTCRRSSDEQRQQWCCDLVGMLCRGEIGEVAVLHGDSCAHMYIRQANGNWLLAAVPHVLAFACLSMTAGRHWQ